jgi:hypothetical protein
MNLTAQNVSETFMNCLFKEGENTEIIAIALKAHKRFGYG